MLRGVYPQSVDGAVRMTAERALVRWRTTTTPVRPWINHLIHDLTTQFGSFEGQKNVGDLYSDRARSQTDQECVAR